MFVWVGNNASPAEKKNGLPVAHVSMLVGWPFCVCVLHMFVCVNAMYVFLSVRAYVRVCMCVRVYVCLRETCLPFCV